MAQNGDISHSASPIRNEDGEMTGVVVVFRDITNQLRAEEELLRADKLESLGVLAGGIAHDFNNVLSGILLKTQLAGRAVMKGKDPLRFLASVEDAAQKAAALNRQLLTFARGRRTDQESHFDCRTTTRICHLCTHGTKVGLDFHIPTNLWAVEVDEGQISQVISNLVINAEQAMPLGGSVDIRAEKSYSRCSESST